METKKTEKFTQSITFKAFIVVFMVLILLIPRAMILSLIRERQQRSIEAVGRINDKWSNAQTICGPILSIPYKVKKIEIETIETKENKKEKREKITYSNHILNITPEQLDIKVKLFPEEKHYSIYKTILYKSQMDISGSFKNIKFENVENYEFQWDKSYITLGVTDLKGVTEELDFSFSGRNFTVEAGGNYNNITDKQLVINLDNENIFSPDQDLSFHCTLNLNGSSYMSFIPIGKTTNVEIAGTWKSPGFIGEFSPEYEISKDGFTASWSILHFNRNIPETWVDYTPHSLSGISFGVNLVNTVDHYQQNERSAKYALMFIALTFVVFFFVEVLTKKKIHPMQYLLVGIALILFYSLLLSFSEQVGFGIAYLIASMATIGLISTYAYSIFKNKKQTGILTSLLCILYVFLYIILQLEDIALLIGSIGLFIILGVIMYISRKINWYKQE